jgi:DNA-binding IclR family transcriptional regulator
VAAKSADKEQKLKPLERYIRALEVVAAASEGIGVQEVAARCELPLATAHRLLHALLASGLIANKSPTQKGFVVGERTMRLVYAGSDRAWISIAVQPILGELADTLGLTSFLTELNDRTVKSYAWAVPESGHRTNVFPGHILPPHAAASAKAILAFQEPKTVREILKSAKLQKFLPNTKTDIAAIEDEHQQIRKVGYSGCWDEIELGVGALGCPVHLDKLGVIYSVGVVGLSARFTERPLKETVAMLKVSAERIARTLQRHQPNNIEQYGARQPHANNRDTVRQRSSEKRN